MVAVKLSVYVGEDRKVTIQVPDEIPVGPAELTIRPTQTGALSARDVLTAAGVLATDLGIPDDTEYVSDEELEELGTMPPGARPSEELIDEGRSRY